MADFNCKNLKKTAELPDEVVLDIIARLPLKQATQCSLLDRNFRRLISQPVFRRRLAAAATIIHFSATWPKVFTRFCDEIGSRRAVALDSMALIVASSNGVLLLRVSSNIYFVFNPITAEVREVYFPAGGGTSVALVVDFDDADPLFKVMTAHAAAEPDRTVVAITVFVPGTGRFMSMKSRTELVAGRSFTLDDVRPVYSAGSLYWLGGEAGVTVAFDLTREQAKVSDGPVTDLDRTGDKWLGYAGGSVRFVHSLQEEIVIYSHDRLRDEWRVDHRIANISSPSNNDNGYGQCIDFDGGRLSFLLRKLQEEGHVYVYDLSRKEWEKSGWIVEDWADGNQHFLSIVPTTAKVSDLHPNDLTLDVEEEKKRWENEKKRWENEKKRWENEVVERVGRRRRRFKLSFSKRMKILESILKDNKAILLGFCRLMKPTSN